jgi:predicted Rossmann fold flavoprotein
MCAIEAGKRGRRTVVLERNAAPGEKIRISGGGRCNFTNLGTEPSRFISANPHFSTSALARYTPADFIALVDSYGIRHHEKKLGQLFCDGSSRQIIDMLLEECRKAGVEILTGCRVEEVRKPGLFEITTAGDTLTSSSLVLATGGPSIPKLGATSFAYELARQFGLAVVTPKPGLVPFVVEHDFADFAALAGISADAVVRCRSTEFRENILFTHRGLSGPAILQISSYWDAAEAVEINLFPECDPGEPPGHPAELRTLLRRHLPRRLADAWCGRLTERMPRARFAELYPWWKIVPTATEGFEKAEVTVGGIDTRELSSKTMEARSVPGLYCIGEAVDVTGWLGGYNFQWAWASGWVAGNYC